MVAFDNNGASLYNCALATVLGYSNTFIMAVSVSFIFNFGKPIFITKRQEFFFSSNISFIFHEVNTLMKYYNFFFGYASQNITLMEIFFHCKFRCPK